MIKIVIAEDQTLLLGALGALLDMETDMTVIGKASNGKEMLEMVETLSPDVCLMDIEMPVMTGLDAAEALKGGDTKVMILTTFMRSGYFQRAKEAGVSGYLLKDTPSETLAASIRRVIKGERVFSPELIDIAFEMDNPLTRREIEIMQHLADGLTTKDTAKILGLSGGTIRNYVSIILDKLGAKNRIEAITTVKEKGWLK